LLQDSFMRLRQAEQLRRHGKFDTAQTICESLIRDYPDYMGAHYALGLIHVAKKNHDGAFNHLSRAAMLNPRDWMTLIALAEVCLELGADEMAALALEQARAIKPQDAIILKNLGQIYRQEREYEHAKEVFHQAVALEANLLPAIMGLGLTCAELGQYAEAAEVYKSVIKRGMSALWILHAFTNIPSAFVNVDLFAELDKLPRNQTEGDPALEETAALVRVKALDKADCHAEAWQLLASVNRVIFLAMQENLRFRTELQRTTLTKLEGHPVKAVGDTWDSGQPISLFILGPSRSGKTTMEQLVATLDGVKRGYESPSVLKAVRRTFQSAGLLTRDYFEMLPAELYPQCRDTYLEELARRVGSARVFTDTNPWRIFDAYLLASTFPNVRFIFLKRNLEDNILRIYQRKYTSGHPYSYDVRAARDQVAWYHQMTDLMVQKFPDIVRVIDYDDMVANPAAAVRVAADLCGLSKTDAPLPEVGDDRGCAAPYHDFIRAELSR
jgi:Flp pilus assembly protein TadD